MAIGIATSPNVVSNTFSDTLSTSSFNAAASTLLVAMVMLAGSTGPTVSGGGLTWSRRVQRSTGSEWAEIWTAPCAAGATGITITVTGADTAGLGLKVDVVTEADLTTPAGATGTGSSATNNVTVTGYSNLASGSRGFCAAVEANNLGLPTSTDDESGFNTTIIDGMGVRKAANTSGTGNSVTFNLDAGGSGTPDWQWAALEIRPAVEESTFVPRAPLIFNQAALQRAANY